jgi:hypothetical protein
VEPVSVLAMLTTVVLHATRGYVKPILTVIMEHATRLLPPACVKLDTVEKIAWKLVKLRRM